MKNCLEKNKENRINDSNIKSCNIFNGINWEDVKKCKINIPIIPNLSGKEDDVQNFDENILSEKIEFKEYINGFDLQKIKYYNDKGYFNLNE
jgi:hypothetical protein